MRIECPNCRGVRTISSDLIVTQKRALALSCSKCKTDIHIQLALPADTDQDNPQMAASSDSSTRLTSQIAETEENSKIVSLKSKIRKFQNCIIEKQNIAESGGITADAEYYFEST
jgi:hypothetical protein